MINLEKLRAHRGEYIFVKKSDWLEIVERYEQLRNALIVDSTGKVIGKVVASDSNITLVLNPDV
jgi:hypothetical protein